jgi:hypothetical protein
MDHASICAFYLFYFPLCLCTFISKGPVLFLPTDQHIVPDPALGLCIVAHKEALPSQP